MTENLKQKLRLQLIAKRKKLTKFTKNKLERKIASNFIASFPLELDDIIAGYKAINNEVSCDLIIEILQDMGFKTALCAMAENSKILEFRQFSKNDKLYPNKYGIFQPLNNKQVMLPKVIFVPLVAVDLKGNRLGYGAGYYDETLHALSTVEDIITVGLAFDFQVIQKVPSHTKDFKLDIVITEKRILIFD
jgi:5-formyltetrahydrofolate cyclo-ligase